MNIRPRLIIDFLDTSRYFGMEIFNPFKGDTTGMHPQLSSNRTTLPATPRWVKWFVMGIVTLVVLFALLHLTGNGVGTMGNHMFHREQGLQQP
jgi:hypothetical protein